MSLIPSLVSAVRRLGAESNYRVAGQGFLLNLIVISISQYIGIDGWEIFR